MSSTMFLDETKLMYASARGISKAPSAFEKLESIVGLKGRRFYGHYNPDTDEYRACVSVTPADTPVEAIALTVWNIPKGNYVYEKIENWPRNKNLIGPTVQKLISENESRVDWSRPILEFYKSIHEMRVMVPILNSPRPT